MSRVTLQDTTQSLIVKMCDGNPGAVAVLCELFKCSIEIDPKAGLGGLHYLLMMDDFGLYGSHIWMLFKDVCGQKLEGVIALFRAHQLGIISSRELRRIVDADEPYDTLPLIGKIRKELPDFALSVNLPTEQTDGRQVPDRDLLVNGDT